MTFPTLRAVRRATDIEFTPEFANRHTFVRLRSGRWCRVLGIPCGSTTVHVRGRIYHSRPKGV